MKTLLQHHFRATFEKFVLSTNFKPHTQHLFVNLGFNEKKTFQQNYCNVTILNK